MADLVRWLTAQLDEDERIARACPGRGEWYAGEIDYVADLSPEKCEHIAEHDPARVLREIDSKRKLLADVLAEPHFRNEEDNWYSCAALTDEDGDPVCLDESRAPGPCDCGRDARVARRVRLLALPFEDRPGFAEAITSAE